MDGRETAETAETPSAPSTRRGLQKRPGRLSGLGALRVETGSASFASRRAVARTPMQCCVKKGREPWILRTHAPQLLPGFRAGVDPQRRREALPAGSLAQSGPSRQPICRERGLITVTRAGALVTPHDFRVESVPQGAAACALRASGSDDPAAGRHRDQGRRRAEHPGRHQDPARHRIQLFVQIQNATNHANYIGYSGTLTSPFFGRPTMVTWTRKVDIGLGLNL